jgi:hypothetical protein
MKRIFFSLLTFSFLFALGMYFLFQPQARAEGENFAPEISDIAINDNEGVVLVGATTTPAVITGSITDNNSCKDLSLVKIAFHSIDSSCASAEDAVNSNDCYFYEDISPAENSNCVDEEDLVYEINHSFPIYYYANSSDWLVEITAVDSVGSSSTVASESIYIDPLLSLTSVLGVDYGVLFSGYVSQGDNISRIKNTGNIEFKILLYGEDLVCSTGTIPVGNQEYALSPFLHGYGSGAVLNNYGSFVNVDMPKPTYDNVLITDDIYWQVSVPAETSGVCTGSVYYIATDDF